MLKYIIERNDLIMSKVTIIEVPDSVFDMPDKYYKGHCISADYALGKGIAVEFDKRYHLKTALKKYGEYEREFPDCILINNIFNIVTKKLCYQKPTYYTLRQALSIMNKQVIENSIRYIALPLIGCGLDKLQWNRVKNILFDVFRDTDCQIVICLNTKKDLI